MGFDLNAFSAQRDKERKKKTQTSASLVDIGSIESELSSIREERLKEEQKALDSKLSPRERKLKTQEKRLNENYGSTSGYFKAASAEQAALQNAGGKLTSLDQIAKDSTGYSFADYEELLNYNTWLSDTDRRAIYNLNKDRSAALQKEVDALTEKAKSAWAKLSYNEKSALIDKNRAAEGKNAVSFTESLALSDKDRQTLAYLLDTKTTLDRANATYDKHGNAAGLTNEEIDKLKDEAYAKGDTEGYFYYENLKGKKEVWDNLNKLYTTKASGNKLSLADEAVEISQMEDGDERTKRLEALEKEFKKLGIDFKTYFSMLVGEEAGLEFFKESEGNALEATGATAADVAMSVGRGAGGFGEGVLDFVGHGIANAADLFGADEFAGKTRIVASTDYVRNWLTSDTIERYSVLGRTSRNILEGVGQVAAMVGVSALGGAAFGPASPAASAFTTATMGASSIGFGTGEAFQSGATKEEAITYGLASGVTETLSEMLFQGLGKGFNVKGISSLDDIVASKVSNVFKKPALKNVVQYAIKSGAEGVEEILAGFGSAVAKKMTYMSEEDEAKILDDEGLLESFIVGTLTSSIAQAPDAIKSTAKGRDFVSGLTTTEQKAIDEILKKRVAEAEKDGKKLDSKEKAKMYDDLIEEMDNGKISIDEIEDALGGETKKKLNELSEKEAKEKAELAEHYEGEDLKKRLEAYDSDSKKKELQAQLSDEVYNLVADSRLSETYNEQARKAVNFSISEEELAKIDEKRRPAYVRAMEEGRLNNTRAAHEILDLTSKIEADKGIKIDLTDTEALNELGYTMEDVVVNGVATADGISVNIKSPKVLNTVVGHELVHVLKSDPKQFESLKKIAFELAKTKGEYDSRWEAVDRLYKDKKGYQGDVAKINEELLADLVGDYLFTDKEFVRSLSVKDRNLFQRIFDEIKYLLKLATAGSAEARQLEKLKKTFEEVYRGDVTMPTDTLYSLSSIANYMFNDPNMSADEFSKANYKETQGYKTYMNQVINNYKQSHPDAADDASVRENLEAQFDGIVRVALAAKAAGYDIFDDPKKRNVRDSKKRLLFSSLEPNSDYFTSNDISSICDKRMNFAEIYDEIVRREEDLGVPANKRFFSNVDNYFAIHKIMADKGLTTPCRQCYVESMRKNLAPMANAFIELIAESDTNNKANKQLYNVSGKNKGKAKTGNFATREATIKALAEYEMSPSDLTVEMLSTAEGLATLKITAPDVYEQFNSFYGQSKPKMPRGATPFRPGELTALLTDEKGKINKRLVNKINSTGGFRLQSYSDFQIENFVDVLQVLFEAGTLGLKGHAYTKVPAFLEATKGTNLKRNISIFMYKDGAEWKIDRNDSFPYSLDEIYNLVKSDESGNTGIVAVSQNTDMSCWIMANDKIGYFIPFHKSGIKMGTVRDTDVKTEDGRTIKGYSEIKDHTKQQSEVWATTTADHKAGTKVKSPINIYAFWDFSNSENLSEKKLIEKNVKEYINRCEESGYLPKFRELVMNNSGVLKRVLEYAKELGTVPVDATIADIAFEHKGYTIPYGYYKCLGDFSMFSPDGIAHGQKNLSLEDYNFDEAVDFFKDTESLRREEVLQQFSNGEERTKYRESNITAEQLKKIVESKRGEVADEVINRKQNASLDILTPKRTAPKVNLPGTVAAPMLSLSEKGAEQKRYGDFNITGEDVALQTAEAVGLPSSVRYRANEYDELMKKAGVEGLPVETPVAPVAETAEPMTEKRAVKDISFVKEPSTVTTETNVEEDGKNAEVLTEEPEVVRKERSKWQGFLRRFVDKFAIFEKISLDNNNRELQARADSLHRADSAAQYFMRHGNKKAGVKSVYDIRKEVKKSGKEQEFSDYMYHVHNIDRMSLESRAAEKIEGIRKDLGNLTDEQIVALSENKITKKTSKEDANKIRKAREFVSISDTKNKPVFGEYTAEDSRGFVAEFEQNNPEFKAWAKDVYNYVNYLRDVMVQEGIISQETADLWSKIYPHYVPIRRDGKTGAAVSVPLDTRKTGVNAPVKKATGGNSDILPLFDTLGARTVQTFNAIAKNRLGVELKNTLNKGAIDETVASVALENPADAVDNHEGWVKEGVDGSLPTFTVFEDGKRVTFEIPEDVYDALKPNDPFYQAPVKPGKDAKFKDKAIYALKKTPEAIGKFRRSVLTEYNPFFMLTNAGKDFQDVLVNSQHPAQTFYEMPNALFNLVFNGKWAKEFYENGGADLTLFERDTNTFEEEKTRAQKIAGFPFKMIPYANNIIEKVPRLAEYIASRKAKRSADVAMLDAARVTTNFAAGGYVTKFANKNGFTFLNASVQGFAQQVRNIREAKHNGFKGWLGLAAKYAIAGIPALVLNAVLWGDDDDYEELSDYVKQNYYVLWKNEDGTFVRFPKGRTLAVIQNGLEQMVDLATGDDEADFAEFARLFIDNLAPSNPLDNNIISPILQAATNTTWYGEDLVPTKLQSVPTEEQFDESTDAISKWIGEKTGISPYKLNYLFDQYSGVIGDIFLPTLTLEAERGDGNIITAPFLDKFTTDPVMKNQNVSDFYELKEELQTIANGSKATDSDILKAKYMADVNKEIADLNAKKREIQNNATLSDEKKYAEVRSIQRQIANLAEVANSSYEKVNVSGKYATVNGVQYRYYEPGEDSTAEPGWRKLSEKQIEKQNKVTKALGISLSEYWSKSEEYNYAFESPNNYAVSKTIGYEAYREYTCELNKIKSDTDAYGNAISGSRKNKVISYINGLDISAIEKVILYKNEYPSDNSYNNAIVNYLNNRNDLSYSDKEKILVALGIVKENKGAISW